jgi:hypothetical protein
LPSEDLPLRDRLPGAVFDTSVGLVLAAIVSLALLPMRHRVNQYPDVELVAAAIIFVLALVVELVAFRLPRPRTLRTWGPVLLPYACGAALFWGLTAFTASPQDGTRPVAPIYLSIALLVTLQLTFALALLRRATARPSPAVGLASTGVLIVEGPTPEFLLVLNRNLNSSKGLWVPPGGHFELDESIDPAARALEKIKTEVGFHAETWEPSQASGLSRNAMSTAETRWLTPPAFVLDEDLLGTCSQGHERHMDFVYVCVVRTNQPVEQSSKIRYPVSEQLRLPVAKCSISAEAALAVLRESVSAWEAQWGPQSSRTETITRDVAERLHLVATAYLEGRA